MIPLRLDDIARVTGGRLHRATGAETVHAPVEFDSRALEPGGLFVALPGERVDGHDFAAAAVAARATAVLAAREVDAPAVIVPPARAADAGPGRADLLGDADAAAVLAALGRLAREVVDRLTRLHDLTVVGLTGSSGKTSTKDLVAGLLERRAETVAPPGSFNNELGHPWTVLRARESTRHLVLELSARGAGHIAALCRVAPPRIGAVLNVGSAHLGEFGSREGIAAAKGELVEALPAAVDGGVAVLSADDSLVAAMAHRTTARVVHVGRTARAEVLAADETLDDQGRASFRLVAPVGEAPVALRLRGPHQVDNALIAAAIALEVGMDLADVAAGLDEATARSRWRMEVTERPDGVRVVNDAYNANPESMRAALRTLAAIRAGAGGSRTAVLGAMAELGGDAPDAHSAVGREVARAGVDRLVVVGGIGGDASGIHEAARAAGVASELVADAETAAAVVTAATRPGDVVLVKASRSAGLERVAAALAEPPMADPPMADPGEGTT